MHKNEDKGKRAEAVPEKTGVVTRLHGDRLNLLPVYSFGIY